MTGRSGLAALLAVCLCGCGRSPVPQPGSEAYRALVRSFYVGLAGLQSGEDVRAKDGLTQATQVAPGEAASWANLAILSVRQQNLDGAFQQADKARSLVPQSSRVEQLLGDIESRRGNPAQAIAHLKRAVELDPKNLKAVFMLAEQTERQGDDASAGQALQWFEQARKLAPENTAVLLEVARLAAKTNQAAVLQEVLTILDRQSPAWPEEVRQQMQKLRQAASGNPGAAALQVAFLRNTLLRVPDYRLALGAAKTPPVFVGDPFLRFLNAVPPADEAAAPDWKTTFTPQPSPSAPDGKVNWLRTIWLDDSGKPTLLWATGAAVHTSEGAAIAFPNAASAAVADLNYDFKNDLVIAGPGGVGVFRQDTPKHFTDVTAESRLPSSVTRGSYTGAWPFDVDLDGDLDIVLGVSGASPIVLRNNGDGTFGIVRPFEGVTGGVSFAAADVDGGGAPGVAMVGSDGKLSLFRNERFGRFRPYSAPANQGAGAAAVSSGDIDSDGAADFVVLKQDGAIFRVSADGSAELARAGAQTAGLASLTLADLDNNGGLDLLTGSGEVFLNNGRGFEKLSGTPAVSSAGAADLNHDGRLDIAGIAPDGKPVSLINQGSKNYRWQVVRTRAATAHGDQRINSFGLGGEIEIRAGLLAEKQIITAPVVHFGLGEHDETSLARIVWPNGSVQAEFDLKPDESILATQRLKGSCPSLFAWDGHRMRFVKDGAPWSPALGLHINAQKVAGITQTGEWFKIRGEELAPKDGFYDLRITAELWETFYIDLYSLMVVDHPRNADIYTDERFSVPPPRLAVYETSNAQPFARAVDDNGGDVSAAVRARDETYLDTFGRGQYQGVTRDHWVELELPAEAPRTGPLYLIAEGWIHPTDATVNIAMGQSGNPPPRGLRIDVPDGRGHWRTAKSGLGFLAGKLKTAVIDLTGIFPAGAPRKFRLGTNMEIYWDRLAWASGSPARRIQTNIPLASAELRHRGFSVMRAANPSSPEIPVYDRVANTTQKWRDLEGYYTRFGDVRELLEKVDDRMVIMNAGDELRLRFAAPPPPPEGWVRDFVMIGDGWIKDGDYNSTFSSTVLPLPYHAMKDYNVPPTTLENDPAYKLHPADWQRFHTRYISSRPFRTELWSHLWNGR
jgi:Tfp pilus assembly protein PilF